MALSLVVLGDIHVSTAGRPSDAFGRIVSAAARLRPDGVVLCGDATSGNPQDGHDLDAVRGWWRALERALAPLRDLKIPILPVAGNHDYYTQAHRQGYREAWHDLAAQVAPLRLSGEPPLYYSTDLGGAHLSFVHVVDQEIDDGVARWLASDLSAASSAAARLVFGHVPLESAMGHVGAAFRQALGRLLLRGAASAYFCGHEHLVWDQLLPFDGSALRQIIVGTPGAGYYYPIRPDLYAHHCDGASGTMPATGVRFAIDPGTRLQVRKDTFAHVTVEGDAVRVHQLALEEDGSVIDFDERTLLRWVQRAVARLLGRDLAESGEDDAATREAVRALQTREGLEPDGLAGPITRRRIRQLLGEG